MYLQPFPPTKNHYVSVFLLEMPSTFKLGDCQRLPVANTLNEQTSMLKRPQSRRKRPNLGFQRNHTIQRGHYTTSRKVNGSGFGTQLRGDLNMTSWWLNQPIWKKYARQIGSWNPTNRVENSENINELPPPRLRSYYLNGQNLHHVLWCMVHQKLRSMNCKHLYILWSTACPPQRWWKKNGEIPGQSSEIVDAL